MLWTAGLLGYPFPERVRAAEAHGYRAISVSAVEMTDLLRRRGRRALVGARRFADEHGVTLEVLEPLVSWLPADPRWRPAQVSIEAVEEIGAALGISAVCVLAARDTGLSSDEVTDRFAALCGRLDQHGWIAALEFAPMSGIRDLDSALELIDRCGRGNAALIFDTWHFFRRQRPPGVIAPDAARRVRYLQVSDAPASWSGSLDRDTYHRLPPGAGACPLVPLLRTFAQAGATPSVGPEVIRPVTGRTCADDVGEATAALDRVLRQAAFSPPGPGPASSARRR